MSFFNQIVYDLITGGGKRTSNYQYNILEDTPLLHDSETLETMYYNATSLDQKASIMRHIDNFHKVTNGLEDYRKIRNKIWDDFTDV